jgi:hypothetical protein
MSGPKEQWLLLHGTPLTPQVWDGVTGYLQDYGPVWSPDVSPGAGVRDVQAALELTAGGPMVTYARHCPAG